LWVGRGRRWRRSVHRRWWCNLDGRRSRARRWWRRRRGCSRRQQRERIHIALRIARGTYAQVDVRKLVLGCPTRPDRPDRRPFANRVTLRNGERAEMDECHRVAVVGLDRDDLSARGHRPRERDVARSRRQYGSAAISADVDAAMLAARIRIAAVDERLEHVSRRRPRPAVSGGRQRKHDERGCDYWEATHRWSPC
jgi:hypothetical protein